MKLSYYSTILLGLCSTFVFAQDDDDSTTSKKTGKVASTDTTKYAGTYDVTYYYNLDPVASNTTQLACKTVTGISITIPDGSSNDITRDFSNAGGKDPIYNTVQGTWTVKELAQSTDFDTMKVNVFINDSEETLACWNIKKMGNDILININPRAPDSCNTRFIPTTKVCLYNQAFLYGTCVSGVCAGEKPKSAGKAGSKTKGAADDDSSSLTTNSNYFLLSGLILSAIFINY